jgi:outer membrane protein assembly factor BamB
VAHAAFSLLRATVSGSKYLALGLARGWPARARVNCAASAVVCYGVRRPAGWRGAAVVIAAAAVTAAVVGVLVVREHAPQTAGGQVRQRPAAQAMAPPEVPPRWSVGGVAQPLVEPSERGPVAADDLVLVSTGFHEPGRVRAYDARTGRLRWAYGTGGTAFVWAVGEGRVIVAPDRGSLIALDLETGREWWRLALSPGQAPEHGTIAGGHLYIGTSFTSEGDLRPPIVYAVDLATGRRRWQAVLEPDADLEWGAPVVEGDLVLVADTPSHQGSAPTSRLHALHADTGRVRWKADLRSREQGFHTERPLVIGGLVLTVTTSGALLAVDAGSGREVWRERRGPFLPRIVGTSDPLVFAIMDGSLVALEARGGNQRWQIPLPVEEREQWAVLAGGTIYAVAAGLVVAIDPASGTERWRVRVGQAVGGPLRVGQRVYVATEGQLVALDAASGGIRWTSGPRDLATGPIAAGGWVVVTTRDGALLAFAR